MGNHLDSSKRGEGVSPYEKVQKDSYRLVEEDPLVDKLVKGQLPHKGLLSKKGPYIHYVLCAIRETLWTIHLYQGSVTSVLERDTGGETTNIWVKVAITMERQAT